MAAFVLDCVVAACKRGHAFQVGFCIVFLLCFVLRLVLGGLVLGGLLVGTLFNDLYVLDGVHPSRRRGHGHGPWAQIPMKS